MGEGHETPCSLSWRYTRKKFKDVLFRTNQEGCGVPVLMGNPRRPFCRSIFMSCFHISLGLSSRFQNAAMRRRRRISHRLVRIVCGRRLPPTWNTVLVLLSIHMYLTVPVILAAGITEQMTGNFTDAPSDRASKAYLRTNYHPSLVAIHAGNSHLS